MRKCFVVLLLFSLIVLSGCKVEHNSHIKQSQLLGEIQTIKATVQVEVPSCTDPTDQAKPSKTLMRANDLVLELFPDSEFAGCKSENMRSIASYITSLEVGTILPVDDEYKYRPKGVGILRGGDGENAFVFCLLAEELRGEIVKAIEEAVNKDITLEVNIQFTNDTDKEARILPYAVFVDGIPYAGSGKGELVIKPQESVSIVLSDVAAQSAISRGGFVPVFDETAESQSDVSR